jgi:succinate dehydrogenase/fumarate reductase flavoprotein subunit
LAQRWDKEVDVAVVGSGGAGLTAAVLAHDNGARVSVLERSDKIGGTTAVSGGGIWVPMNHHMAGIGAQDTREEALAYCKKLAAARSPDELIETFVDTAPTMLRYLEEHTPVRYRAANGRTSCARRRSCSSRSRSRSRSWRSRSRRHCPSARSSSG